MARYITVHVKCDWTACDTVAEEGDGTVEAMTIAVDGKPGKEFLLCKPHRDQVDEFLLPLLQAGVKVENGSGRKKAKASAAAAAPATPTVAATGGQKAENVECKVDGCGRTLHNRTGMAQHVIRTHDYPSLAAYEAEFGTID